MPLRVSGFTRWIASLLCLLIAVGPFLLTLSAPIFGAAGASTINVGNAPDYVAVNPNTGVLYVTVQPTNAVYAIDAATGAIIANISIGSYPRDVVVNPSNGMVYVANQGSDSVSVIDGTTNKVMATVPVGRDPVELAVNPNTGFVYVDNQLSQSMSVIDGSTNTVVATVTVGCNGTCTNSTAGVPTGVDVNQATNKVYVSSNGINSLQTVDGATDAVVNSIRVGTYPDAVAVDPKSSSVYVANLLNNTVSVVNANVSAVTTTLRVGSLPGDEAFDPSLGVILVTNGGDNSVSIINASTKTVVGTAAVGQVPMGIAIDSATGEAYVANTRSGTVSVIPILEAISSSLNQVTTSSNSSAGISNTSSTAVVSTQTSLATGPPQPISCGYHSEENANQVVASSPLGAGVRITVGEPSWLQLCETIGRAGESFPAYEVFPVKVYATPGTSFSLSIGRASHTPQQIAMGFLNNTIWTGFNPVNVTTNSEGFALSNFTLAGAVMPFVPNDIANVSLPIIAHSPSGIHVAAGLPIEFSGSEVGGIDIIHVLNAPGPLTFSGAMQGSAGNPTGYAYGIVYAPPASSAFTKPLPMILSVAGSWNNGIVGPLPPGVQVTIAQPSFILEPNQVFYFFIDENNSIAQSTAQSASNFTFAIQENVGGNSYLEPLSVSIVSGGIFGSFGAFPTSSGNPAGGNSENGFYSELGLITVPIIVALTFCTVYLRQRKWQSSREGDRQAPDDYEGA